MTIDALRARYTLPEGAFASIDSMSVELEVAELLYALVRAMKPAVVVEAGTGRGYASRFIAEALRENGKGHLWTYEHDPVFAAEASEALADSSLPVTVVAGFSWAHHPADADLVFLDTLGDYRDDDIKHWLPSGAVMVVHDANGYPDLPDGVRLTAGRGVWIGRA